MELSKCLWVFNCWVKCPRGKNRTALPSGNLKFNGEACCVGKQLFYFIAPQWLLQPFLPSLKLPSHYLPLLNLLFSTRPCLLPEHQGHQKWSPSIYSGPTCTRFPQHRPDHSMRRFTLRTSPFIPGPCLPCPAPHCPAIQFSSVQSLSCVRLFATPWTPACQASLFITNSRSLVKLISIESVMPSNLLIVCHPLFLPPSIFPRIRVFSNESVLRIRPKCWSFSFDSPSNEYSGLIPSFRMDWLDLLAVQGTLKSILQHHSWKASILWRSAFFRVQLSHPYMTTGKAKVWLVKPLLA